MSHGRFTAILKYLRFDDKPNRACSGPGADRFALICVVLQTFACMCQWKYKWKFSLTVDEHFMLLKPRFPFIILCHINPIISASKKRVVWKDDWQNIEQTEIHSSIDTRRAHEKSVAWKCCGQCLFRQLRALRFRKQEKRFVVLFPNFSKYASCW